MFFVEAGKPVAPVLQITEIFRSIQGESTRAGLPCTFIRLTGCNLRCTWCDTEYSFYGGARMTLDEVMSKVADLGGKLVEVTGGEPLLQKPVYPLMDRLLGEGYRVMLETSGERPIDKVPAEVIKIVDVKCPDSGEPDTFRLENLDYLSPHDELKFVIATRRDYEFAPRSHKTASAHPARRGGHLLTRARRDRLAEPGRVDAERRLGRSKIRPPTAQDHLGGRSEGGLGPAFPPADIKAVIREKAVFRDS